MNPTETLREYLGSIKNTPYSLGQHDCLIFTNTCFDLLYGKPWCQDWLSLYNSSSTFEHMPDAIGFNTLEAAIDSRLDRCFWPLSGSLVAVRVKSAIPLGYGLGISLGVLSVFVGPAGLTYLPNNLVPYAWINPEVHNA